SLPDPPGRALGARFARCFFECETIEYLAEASCPADSASRPDLRGRSMGKAFSGVAALAVLVRCLNGGGFDLLLVWTSWRRLRYRCWKEGRRVGRAGAKGVVGEGTWRRKGARWTSG